MQRNLTAEITGALEAQAAMLYLMNRSIWAIIDPLPDDHWEITVKEEHRYLLMRALGNPDDPRYTLIGYRDEGDHRDPDKGETLVTNTPTQMHIAMDAIDALLIGRFQVVQIVDEADGEVLSIREV